MKKYPLRLAGAFTCAALALSAATAHAKSSDARAKGLLTDALEQDYLATNFKAADAKLGTAWNLCSKSKDACTDETRARIQRAIGVVKAGGMNDRTGAVKAFEQMLKLSPEMALDPNFTTEAIEKAFDEAKAITGPTAPKAVVVDRSVGVLDEKPWTEQSTYHPIPVFVSLPEGVKATKVVARYRIGKNGKWEEQALKKVKGGFGGYLPCRSVEQTGSVYYFTTAFDENLDRVASAGSQKSPRQVQVKEAIDGRPPALPGQAPPSECARPMENSGLSCDTNDDCPGNQVCEALYCVDRGDVPEEPEDPNRRRENWFSLSFSPDLAVVSSANDACSPAAQADGQRSCFYSNGQVVRDPDPGVVGANTIGSGVAPGSMRVMVGYDRVLAKRMTIGAKLGFAFLGHPTRDDDGKSFLPIHAEVRFAFFLAPDPFTAAGVRPYGYVGGGIGDANGRVTTQYQEENRTAADVDVYSKGGPGFAGLGLGLQYSPDPHLALVIEAGVRQHLGSTSATVIAPSLGFAYGL